MTFWKTVLAFAVFLAATSGAHAASFPNDCTRSAAWMEPLSPKARKADASQMTPDQQRDYFAKRLNYICSGDYRRDIADVVDSARAAVAQKKKAAAPGAKLALVLDIDETSLDNEIQILGGSFRVPSSGGNDPCKAPAQGCGYTTWERMAKAPPIRPTLELFREAKADGIAVFFITGRNEDGGRPSMRAATRSNLKRAGYADYTCLFLQPTDAASARPDWTFCPSVSRPGNFAVSYPKTSAFKDAVRKAIADAGYTTVANVGDQPGDLTPTDDVNQVPPDSYLLPNPFY